jgi:hypothetical protein
VRIHRSPVGTTFVLAGLGGSSGAILFDPSTQIDNVQADLGIAITGFSYTFSLGRRQARILTVFPIALGTITGNVNGQEQSHDVAGLVDPRIKLSVGLVGLPALTAPEFQNASKKTVVGASITLMPPLGQYDSGQVVNLGYNRWGFKPEIGISHPIGKWTIEGYGGVWLYTTNHSYYPGQSQKKQDPVAAIQGHASYSLSRSVWIAFDATWFSGGQTRIDRVVSSDFQRNSRFGVTLSVPIVRQQSLKFSYSTGATTRRGSDFDSFTVVWQAVRL